MVGTLDLWQAAGLATTLASTAELRLSAQIYSSRLRGQKYHMHAADLHHLEQPWMKQEQHSQPLFTTTRLKKASKRAEELRQI
jgi:hypothetical protein